MSNVLFAYPNTADSLTLSGGRWASTMPLTNLQDRVIKNMARTSNALASSTTFNFTYAAAALVGFIGLVNHNLSTAATVRFRGFSTALPTLECDFTGAYLDPRFTFTRSTVGTYINAAGLVATAAIDAVRFEYDITTHACRGLLIEPPATNSCLRSNDLTNAIWTKVSAVTNKLQTGPDGVTNSASMFQANVNFTSSCLQTVTAASGTRYFSAWVKRLNGSGTVTMTAGNAVYVDITSQLTTSWTRISVPAQTATNPVVGFFVSTSGDQIAVWGAQLETTAVTSTIETTTATVTRAGDLCQATSTNFSGWYSQTEGTFAAAFTLLGDPPASSAALYSAASGATNYISATVTTARSTSLYVKNTTDQANIGGTVVAADTLSYIASAYKVNDFATSLNAAAASTDTSGTLPTPTKLVLGEQNGTVANNASMILAKLKYWPTRMSDARLAAISTSAFDITADYDSGLLDALPAAYVAATTPAQRASLTQSTPHKLATPQTYQYWRCDITDTANTDGYVQIGRLMVADTAFQPTYNASYGANIQWVDRAIVSEADSGAEYAYARPGYRVFKCATDWLTEVEAMTKVLEMQRTLGTTGELYVMFDPADTTYLPNRSFLARMRSLGALETPLYGFWRTGWEFKELL